MPSVLSDTKVCQSEVPRSWKPVLKDLILFFQLESKLRHNPEEATLNANIQLVHDRLVANSEQLMEPASLRDLSDLAVHSIFAKSLFLLMRIATAVSGDDEILDTAGCRILHLYKSDFLANTDHQNDLRQALRKTVHLTESELQAIESGVAGDVRHAERKHRIVRAIRDRFELWQDSQELRSNIFQFFDAVYPDTGIQADEIELIVTGTMIFFCLPFHKDELTTKRYQRLSDEQKEPIRDFLRRNNRFSQWQFAHFPVFGFRRGTDLDTTLLNELQEACGLSADAIAKEISTLTAVVPITEIDKYVVHDIWGHSWQACMLGFDELYIQLATYADPLDLSEQTTRQNEIDPSVFSDCFSIFDSAVQFHEDRFVRFVNLEVAERLPIAMTPVLAEVLADVAEFKLLAVNQTSNLETTSAFKRFPAKLDLTMRDVLFYFRQATKAFRLWAAREDRLQRTVDQLVANGGTRESAKQAVEAAAERWRQLETDWFAPEIKFSDTQPAESIHVNMVSRLTLNFLAIHRETLAAYKRIGDLDTGNLPVKGFRDLLLICVAVFFEDSPSRNLWRVDEFLSLKIEPLCEMLAKQS